MVWKIKSKTGEQIRWKKSKSVGYNKELVAEVTVTRIVGKEYGVIGVAGIYKRIGIRNDVLALVKKLKNVTSIRKSKSEALKVATRFRKAIDQIIKR